MTIYLYYIGKPRDRRLTTAAEEYLKRASRWARCRMAELDPRRTDFWTRHAAARKVLLDAGGRQMDSAAFTELVRQAEMRGQDLAFLIGGAEGLPEGWAERADLLLSLSRLTFAHELARLLLAEQIYRALAGLRGHPYPK